MGKIQCFLFLILFTGNILGSKIVQFKLSANESIVKQIDFDKDFGNDTSSYASSSYVLSVQTSSPLNIYLSGSPECQRILLAENSGSIEMEIPDDIWINANNCNKTSKGKVYLHMESIEKEAIGNLKLNRASRKAFKARITDNGGFNDPNHFLVSEHNPYIRSIKLQSLQDNVKISLTSENAENALEVYITFCPENKGILYTTSYAPNFEITLKSPRMEMYYDAYSCDSSVAFYSNSTQPTSPLIIRLESQFSINGSMIVLINGAEPSLESHVAFYETGTFTVEQGEMRMIELKYQSTMENIHAFLDVVTGAIDIHLSPCKSQETDIFYSNLAAGSHRIDIDLKTMMDNTTCSLVEIDPTTVYMFIKSSTTTTFTLWIPGEIATWYVAITIGLVLLLLVVCMILIIHFGRRKTGKLTINYFK
ncbi:Cadherin domain-containing protein [Caenorhabditis elegans]|uniref:Cadherin domain-containing protein n=1 Tax=Caenorhabditis elegans TaxID=6239 RepID=O76721_CAEEL|nr:Cadherin domain-containing protein [Caenorhabditis elegans]CCD70673.2 Cadherin domain-containing protein [Caenorhabditis elegans]|eukprot:NP_500769.3 Uncharacterized protein CELE_F36H12.17 [Caenorhabditis elegans]